MKFNSVFLAVGLLSAFATAAPTDIKTNSPAVNSVGDPMLERRVEHEKGSHTGSSEEELGEIKMLSKKAQKLSVMAEKHVTTLEKEEEDAKKSKGSTGGLDVSADLKQAQKADAKTKKLNLSLKKLLKKMSTGRSHKKTGTKLKARTFTGGKKSSKAHSSKEPDDELTQEEKDEIRKLVVLCGDMSGELQEGLEEEKKREKKLKQAGQSLGPSFNDILRDHLNALRQAESMDEVMKSINKGIKKVHDKMDIEEGIQ